MLDKIFDKLPYEVLEKVKFLQLLLGAAGIGLFLLAVHYFTLYSWAQDDFAALAAKKQEAEKKLKSDEELVARTGATQKDLAATFHDFANAKRGMPLLSEIPALLNKIGEFENELGVEISMFRIEEGVIGDYFKEIPIYVELRGDFWNAVGFFDKLHDLLRVISVSELKMEMPQPKAKKKAKKGEEEEEPQEEVKKPTLITSIKARTYGYIDGAEDKPPAK
ncbi:MAG: type 4a pilus biogenesis protein PilO [Nitrospinae bacterium]|nr:type 4a pilus biogenesis protein PilO [Nitrospinota bacterium]